MIDGINVLSLFDGMSCGQLALKKLGIKVNKYFASEIDKYAIQVTQKNFPETIQLGDVKNVKAIDLPKIDLLLAGSPCQGFSFSGKKLAFNDPRSALFFEFVRVKNEVNPKYYLLENVRMKKQHENVISDILKTQPLIIDAALLSAQKRIRLYWTNINEVETGLFGDKKSNIPQPKDKSIMLSHIIEKSVDPKYFITYKMLLYLTGKKNWNSGKINFRNNKQKATCLTASMNNLDVSENFLIDEGIVKSKKANCLQVGGNGAGFHTQSTFINAETILLYKDLHTHKPEKYFIPSDVDLKEKTKIRRLTPLECERLQCVPDNYTDCVSDAQRYTMLGNGWNVDVIAHILNYIK